MSGHRLCAAEKIFVTGEHELCESVLDAGRLGLTYVEAGRFLLDHSEHSLCEGPVLVVAAGTDAPLFRDLGVRLEQGRIPMRAQSAYTQLLPRNGQNTHSVRSATRVQKHSLTTEVFSVRSVERWSGRWW
jgi:hypothetical protein